MKIEITIDVSQHEELPLATELISTLRCVPLDTTVVLLCVCCATRRSRHLGLGARVEHSTACLVLSLSIQPFLLHPPHCSATHRRLLTEHVRVRQTQNGSHGAPAVRVCSAALPGSAWCSHVVHLAGNTGSSPAGASHSSSGEQRECGRAGDACPWIPQREFHSA
jgi:hypothetical protein